MEGNQQKMRETMLVVRDALDTISAHEDDIEFVRAWIAQTKEAVQEALSEPPRNCDEYDCKSDAEVGFVKQTGETDESPLYWQLFANWLFATAEERKGEGDGK